MGLSVRRLFSLTNSTDHVETISHVAFLCLPNILYQVDLIAKTYKVISSEVGGVGFNFESMGLKVVDVIHEEPDPHLFLLTADLRPE
jgi:hypothetical protein